MRTIPSLLRAYRAGIGALCGAVLAAAAVAPVNAQGLSAPRRHPSIAAGLNHPLRLMPDGTVWAWGGNGSGQLGDGTNANADVPVQAKNLRDVTAISAGRDHAMAVRVGGTVWVWGSNEHGELGPAGPSGIEDSNVPLRVLFTTETNPDGD